MVTSPLEICGVDPCMKMCRLTFNHLSRGIKSIFVAYEWWIKPNWLWGSGFPGGGGTTLPLSLKKKKKSLPFPIWLGRSIRNQLRKGTCWASTWRKRGSKDGETRGSHTEHWDMAWDTWLATPGSSCCKTWGWRHHRSFLCLAEAWGADPCSQG